MNQTQSITTPPNISRHHEQVGGYQTSSVSDGLTKSLESKLNAPASSPEFDLHTETNAVLKDIGLTTADAGGKLTFLRKRSDSPKPDAFRDNGRSRFGRKKRRARCTLETSHRRRTGYLGGRAQGTAAFRRIL